jgi:hypothetical protein
MERIAAKVLLAILSEHLIVLVVVGWDLMNLKNSQKYPTTVPTSFHELPKRLEGKQRNLYFCAFSGNYQKDEDDKLADRRGTK